MNEAFWPTNAEPPCWVCSARKQATAECNDFRLPRPGTTVSALCIIRLCDDCASKLDRHIWPFLERLRDEHR